MITTLALIAVVGLQADSQADGITMKFVSSGVTRKVGGYRPIRAEMTDKSDAVKKAPEGLTSPKYGTLKMGDASWAFVLDEPEGKPAKLYVDTNGDGDLTNDPATKWESKTENGQTMYSGESQIDLGGGQIASLGMYRFDPNDARRAPLKNTILYYSDFGYEVTIRLDGNTHTSFVSGKPDRNSSFWIDRDGNKKISYKREMASVGKPFNFTGTTYEIKVDGDKLKLEKAAQELPIAPMPPDIGIGKKAIPFNAVAMDGSKIDFPKTYSGKIVMLDFWATWCGPCIGELPNVKKAYETWHDKGFEVLGVSFDNQNMAEKLTTFTKEQEMPWQQIYEGKGWETNLGELYDVSSIPFVLLVDGDTGEILAMAEQLRGPGLTDLVGKAIAKKTESNK